jgi:hypothetical protein
MTGLKVSNDGMLFLLCCNRLAISNGAGEMGGLTAFVRIEAWERLPLFAREKSLLLDTMKGPDGARRHRTTLRSGGCRPQTPRQEGG